MTTSLVENVWVEGVPYGPSWPDHGLPPMDAVLPDRVWSDGPPARSTPKVEQPPAPESPPPDRYGDLDGLTRDELADLAHGLGVKVHHRAGAPRLRTLIREALAGVDG